ncbi:MAG: single-stranded-DNA-specific exonuclease RecJ [Oscillospiraceae bacterium]|jgi:single-stranded-DNA-specific exonuclease|nr:single-stranded-DNA-specific exonuclease RecJ [Oscillospiraceae bacterium]
MKYQAWTGRPADDRSVERLEAAGYGPLLARVLCARGCAAPTEADAFLSTDLAALPDPFLLRDMDRAVARIRQGLAAEECMAVYGDYDVDGITATALFTHALRARGARVIWYVPDRLEEGYGLNVPGLAQLREQGVSLVVTVDTGVTAVAEAEAARALGLDLVITDHHQCREMLPDVCAVVNPCRPDCGYPSALAGVGVAFKLLCALEAPVAAAEVLARYGDLVALGTVADIMPLTGENRALVARGLSLLESSPRLGIRYLLQEAGLTAGRLTADSIGYGLGPRLNAAGRMGRAQTAVELLLTDEPAEAARLAGELCDLNRHRRQVENAIFKDALALLADEALPPAIVLAGRGWHAGVIGIVAARLADHFERPVFLICLEDESGRGSARSAGGLNLVDALTQASDLLDHYGGHEKAAGFALPAAHVDALRERLCGVAGALTPAEARPLIVDAFVTPRQLTMAHVDELRRLEPHGTGCPTPVFCLEGMCLGEVRPVGGGRHLRLSVSGGGVSLDVICFGTDAAALGYVEGDMVDLSFHAEINTFRNRSQVQLRFCDMRLAMPERAQEERERALYARFEAGGALTGEEAALLRPSREELATVWRYLKRMTAVSPLTEQRAVLARKIMRAAGLPGSFGRVAVALDVFSELSLIRRWEAGVEITIEIAAVQEKVDLAASRILASLAP